MEIKNLFHKLKQPPKPPEHFFALELSDDTLKSAVWTVIEGHTKIVKIGPTKSWDGQNEEVLLKAVDESLSTVSENLDLEPNGVIFGLPETWTDEEGISTTKKKLLKYLSEQLELKPLGFVITDSAIIQYLKIEEGTPPSAVFLQVGSSDVNVSLVKLGKILGTQLVGKSEDLGQDVEEGLSRFDKVDTLPSRMILYDGQADFEELKQQLTSYAWEEKLPFIHFPKVESLPADASIKAIALAGGSEVAKSLGIEVKPRSKQKTEADIPTSAASLGFAKNEDVAANQEQSAETVEPTKDETKASEPTEQIESVGKPKTNRLASLVQLIKLKASSASDFFDVFKNLLGKINPKNKLALIGSAFLLLLILVIGLYWYIPKATVTLVLQPQSLDESLSITINPKASSIDSEKNILPGTSVEIDVSGSKTVSTTGTNLIGDPAKGEVTLYNKTNDVKSFDADTVLVGSGGLTFTINDDTTIASNSATSEGIAFGKATVNITAVGIGPEANLSSDTELSFQDFSESSYSARVNTGLSGGTAREVRAVAEEDELKAVEELVIDLKIKAQKDLKSNLGEERALVDIKEQEELTSQSFNHQVGEEAESLIIEGALQYTALSYSQQELKLLLENAVKEKVPDNFQLSASSQTELEPATLNEDGTAKVVVNFAADLIPKLDFAEIKKNLKGRYPNLVQEYLAQLPSFVRAEISIKPNFPGPLKTLPRVTKNITIEVKVQE